MTCSDPHVCPECVEGKHRNCAADAWCFERDELVGCRCWVDH